jgi:hypothetical protein
MLEHLVCIQLDKTVEAFIFLDVSEKVGSKSHTDIEEKATTATTTVAGCCTHQVGETEHLDFPCGGIQHVVGCVQQLEGVT